MLRWNAPGWANNNDKIYTWYKKTILERVPRPTGSWSTTSTRVSTSARRT